MTIPNTPSTAWVLPGLMKRNSSYHGRYTMDDIIIMTCQYFGISEEQLFDHSHKKEVVYCRDIAIYLICNKTKNTLRGIAIRFGRKEHTSIRAARNKMNGLVALKHEDGLRSDIEGILNITPHMLIKFSS